MQKERNDKTYLGYEQCFFFWGVKHCFGNDHSKIEWIAETCRSYL